MSGYHSRKSSRPIVVPDGHRHRRGTAVGHHTIAAQPILRHGAPIQIEGPVVGKCVICAPKRSVVSKRDCSRADGGIARIGVHSIQDQVARVGHDQSSRATDNARVGQRQSAAHAERAGCATRDRVGVCDIQRRKRGYGGVACKAHRPRPHRRVVTQSQRPGIQRRSVGVRVGRCQDQRARAVFGEARYCGNNPADKRVTAPGVSK